MYTWRIYSTTVNMLRFLCLVLVVGGLSACKQSTIIDPAAPIDPGLTWQARPDFIYGDKVQLNSYADSSLIILAGSQTTSILPNKAASKTDTSFTHYGGLAQPNGETYQRPAITSKLIAFAHSDYINIASVASPVTNYSNSYVRLRDLDPDFAQTALVPAFAGDCMAVNQQQQILMPYYKYDPITPSSVTATELDNTGLAGNQITSVAAFRNTVYVSTLSGVFTKPVRTFLTPKKG